MKDSEVIYKILGTKEYEDKKGEEKTIFSYWQFILVIP